MKNKNNNDVTYRRYNENRTIEMEDDGNDFLTPLFLPAALETYLNLNKDIESGNFKYSQCFDRM
ncbi:CLUMA_CG012522, isoform A [Clunio marinus]|uniref:CLUMA_CG012522, isoform A n=1 Tax=Clunio marinus TaxID=568069 RepID=A0A1J1IG15_9DIPT|nr:CLUMA_CG012522, isoform A [Clunio marinus]